MNRLIIIAAFASTMTFPIWAQSAATGSQQIGPGTTSSLNPNGPKKVPANPHKILDSALTPETRATLQQAMNANPDGR
jgi:hypothetical protein